MKFRHKWFIYWIYWNIRYWKCWIFGHDWEEIGGRACPKEEEISDCFQTVYRCYRCKEEDYGDEGGPGYEQCFKDCFL